METKQNEKRVTIVRLFREYRGIMCQHVLAHGSHVHDILCIVSSSQSVKQHVDMDLKIADQAVWPLDINFLMVYKMYKAILYSSRGDKCSQWHIIASETRWMTIQTRSFSISRSIESGDNPFSPVDSPSLYTGLSRVYPDVDLGWALICTSRI